MRMIFGLALCVVGALMIAYRCSTETGWYTPWLWSGGLFLVALGGAVIADREAA